MQYLIHVRQALPAELQPQASKCLVRKPVAMGRALEALPRVEKLLALDGC